MVSSLSSGHFLFKGRHGNSTSWRFALLSILTPSFIFILASFYYSPMRVSHIFALGIITVMGVYIHRYIFFLLLAGAMILDGALFAANYFQMSLSMVFDATQYLNRLDLLASVTYGAVICISVVCLIATYRITQRAKHNRNQLGLYPFFIVLFAYAGADWVLNAPSHWEIRTESFLSDPFDPITDAATISADVEQQINSVTQPNILIVIVEGLGTFRDGKKQELIWGPLLEDGLKKSYEVQTGNTEYIGSTSSAEVRELCNRMADYRDFRDRDTVQCLPLQALESGYKTAAFHGFSGRFFERFDWYPKIGFQDLNFLENKGGLEPGSDLPQCGSTFEGLCDTDVARSVNMFLHKEDPAPKFAYWLTLNSHKPVAAGEVPERLNCEDGGVFEDQELCRMGEQWLNISHLVTEIALDPTLRRTEIVLVGDHHPPLFTRHGRSQFEPRQVAWLHLKPVNTDPAKLASTNR